MTFFLKQNSKKFLAFYFLSIFNKLLTLSHGNLLLKLWTTSILDLLLKNGLKHFKMVQNHAFYRMVICLIISVFKEAADKGTQFPHTFLFYVQKF